MRRYRLRLIALALAAAAIAAPASAQQRVCPHNEGERDKINATLKAAASCRFAYDLLNACRSNTGGDVELADIVIARCESEFAGGMSSRARQAYQAERAACRQRYARQRGTMYVSFSVTCEAGVAARFADRAARRAPGR